MAGNHFTLFWYVHVLESSFNWLGECSMVVLWNCWNSPSVWSLKLPTGNPRCLGKSLHFTDLFLCGWMSLPEFSEGQWYRNPECFPRSRAKLLQIDMIEDENCRASQAWSGSSGILYIFWRVGHGQMTKSNQTSMAIVALRESYRPKDINQPSSLNKALKTYFLLGGLLWWRRPGSPRFEPVDLYVYMTS